MVYNITVNNTNNISIYNNVYKYTFRNGNFEIPDGSEMCINQLVIPYSWYNITSQIGNNTFYYLMPITTSSYTLNATASTTITVSAITGSSNLQIGSVIICSSNPVNTTAPYLIYITALGTGTGGNGTYIINQACTYSASSGSTTQILNTVTLSNGFYTVSDINNALCASQKANGYYFYNTNPNQMTGTQTGTYAPNIIYPIQLISTPTPNYTNAFVFQYIPTGSTNITTQFGTNYNWYNGTATLPTTASTPQIIIPYTVTNSTNYFGNVIGFTYGTYPSSIQTYSSTPTTQSSAPYYSYGNSLNASPPFPAVGSIVNALIIRCNIADNSINGQTDIIDCLPISSTFGSNIYYSPISANWIKLKYGKYKDITFSFCDQNFNQVYINDPNLLLTVLIRFPGE